MRSIRCVIVLAGALATSACTVVGTAVGAGMPRYEQTDWRRSPVPLGTRVRVHVRSFGADTTVIGRVDGRYGGIRDGLLSVTDDEGREHELPVRDVAEVEVRNGTEWAKGLLIGVAADTVALLAIVAVSNGAHLSIATAP